MVDENILKLQIKRLRDHLHNKADHVLSLETQRLQLETVIFSLTIEWFGYCANAYVKEFSSDLF